MGGLRTQGHATPCPFLALAPRILLPPPQSRFPLRLPLKNQFPIGIPLAHLVLSRARQHPDQARVTKAVATIALVLSHLGIVLITLLAARQTRH